MASFSDAAPETGNSFNTALWENYVAAADSYIEQDSPTATHGTDTLLTVAAWGAGGGKNNRLLADFDVSGIAPGNEILKAELELCATSVPGTSRTYDIHQVNSTWTETGVTWNNQPTVVAGASDSVVIPAAPGCVLWSIVDDVQLWVVGVTNNGVRINDSVEGGSNNETIFRSRENSVTTDRPNLYIVYRTCIDSTAPGAPTGLNAAGTDSLVTLDWNDNGELDLAGYNVYRSTTQGGPYTKISGSLLTASAYSDTGVTNGTTYYYVVRALDKCDNESTDSNEDSATPQTGPPEPPTNLTATPGNTEVALDWDDNAEPDLAGYNVYRSTTSGGPYTKVNGPLVTPSAYTDTGLSNGTPYYYVVRAENDSAEESGDSNEATATPVDAPPAPPTGLGATPGDTTVALDWDDNGEPDLAGYN
ncbi:MAG: DNRLRE domain-containing protein, partial [Chloroflexi bacterium]|nr:DNRLRE domain-containing protein [Chloroflexota bacterium]